MLSGPRLWHGSCLVRVMPFGVCMADRPRATLCVAEKNANIRDLLRREFGREGYAVLTAGSGVEVRRLLDSSERLDLLILDAEIDDPEGGSLAALLRRLDPSLPVVLHVFPGEQAMESACLTHACVKKGGDLAELKEAVRQALEASGLVGPGNRSP